MTVTDILLFTMSEGVRRFTDKLVPKYNFDYRPEKQGAPPHFWYTGMVIHHNAKLNFYVGIPKVSGKGRIGVVPRMSTRGYMRTEEAYRQHVVKMLVALGGTKQGIWIYFNTLEEACEAMSKII